MKQFKISFNQDKSIEVEKGYIVDNYISNADNIGYSVVRTHLDGKHPVMKNINSNRTYYLINGYALFKFADEKIKIEAGEMIVIPKNTKYGFEGKFDAILIDAPAFNPSDDIIYNEEI